MTAAFLPGVGNRPADPVEATAVHAARLGAIPAPVLNIVQTAPPTAPTVRPGTAGELAARLGAGPSHPLLTPRQHDVLLLLASGQSSAEMAVTLGVNENTVKTHAQRVVDRLGGRNRAHAVDRAHRLGLLRADSADTVDRDHGGLDELWATGRGECT